MPRNKKSFPQPPCTHAYPKGSLPDGSDVLRDRARIRAQRLAIGSALFGCVSEVLFESSPVVIIYLMMLDGGDGFSMFSSSIPGIAISLLVIPCAGLADRIGLKRSVRATCWLGFFSLMLIASAPFLGKTFLSRGIVIAGCFLLALTRPLFTAAWFPILDDILLPEERNGFFGMMRFYYTALTTAILLGLGLAVGRKPPIWILQIFFVAVGAMVLVRMLMIDRIPIREDSGMRPVRRGMKESLKISLRNSELTGFSVYVAFLTFASLAYPPLVFIYLKSGLNAGNNTVLIISSLAMLGTLAGYFFAGRLLSRFGSKPIQIAVHLVYIGILFGLGFCGKESWSIPVIAVLMLAGGFNFSCYFVCLSTEMLSLARPDNRTMAVAFCNTFHYSGWTLSRIGGSIVLGSGILAANWSFGSLSFSSFQTLFLFSGCFLTAGLALLILVPSVNPVHEDYYNPASSSSSEQIRK